MMSEVQEKRKKTNLKRYGVEVPMMNKAISSKMIKTKIVNNLTLFGIFFEEIFAHHFNKK